MVSEACATMRRVLIAVTVLLVLASAASAQSITDARRVEFTPSTDHNATDPASGVALRKILLAFTGTTGAACAKERRPSTPRGVRSARSQRLEHAGVGTISLRPGPAVIVREVERAPEPFAAERAALLHLAYRVEVSAPEGGRFEAISPPHHLHEPCAQGPAGGHAP